MDDVSVCAPLLAESDTQNNTSNAPNAASVIDADKVINTKIDNSQGEGDTDEEERLRCLLADTYCHVCDAVLTFESQRLSHYEGKRHAQKVKVYLQTRRAEKTKTMSAGGQSTMTTDKTRFCELCNMVFSSSMVSKSHYEGKVHAKNLRKQGFQSPVINRSTEVSTLPRPSQEDPDQGLQSSAAEGGVQHHVDLGATTTTSSTEVDLKDPNKYCGLCTASFNNPQMALQHYNGRKHQRNQSRQELMRRLGDDVQQADHLMCQMCSLEFNSVEMYQAHVQGSKHQIRKKKVLNLCKSQHKVYGTFADELADYVQVQKARGITTKTTQVLPQGDTLNREEEEEEDDEEGLHHVLNTQRQITELNKPIHIFTPTPDPLHLSGPGCYYPAKGWHTSYHPHNWDYSFSTPVLPGPGSPQFTSRPMRGRKRRRQSSSSSSYTTSSSSSSSSYSSSSSSSTSERDDSEYKRRERRRVRRSKKERGRRTRDKDSGEEEKTRSKKQRKEREDNETTMARRGESVESEQGRRRRRQREHGRRRKDKKPREVEFEEEGGDKGMHNPTPEDSVDSRKHNEVHIHAEMNVEQDEDGQDEATKAKYRKEKKKVKEKADTRTEEEKLWDDSILGC